MFDLFYKYLILNRKASVPGIGTFTLTRQAAQLNFAEKAFVAPFCQVRFTQGDNNADENFYSFISSEQKVERDEAKRLVDEFAVDVKQLLKVNKEISWEGIGIISQNTLGELQLEQQQVLQQYFPHVPADRIERENNNDTVFEKSEVITIDEPIVEPEEVVEEQEKKKQDWWIDAIILALLAIAAIGYYFLQNGTLLH